MCWYKSCSKNILFSLQKYFIVLLIIFTFSQKIIGDDTSEKDIKAKFEEIKKKQRFSCCINFENSDMNFALNLFRENKELKKNLSNIEKLNNKIENLKQLIINADKKKEIVKEKNNNNEEQINKYKE